MEPIELLVLRLTERCNLRCTYCYASCQTAGADMSVQTALRAVELCCPPGGRLRVQFTGGEPLLRLDVMEAVAAFARESGRTLEFSVQTNGTLLNDGTVSRLAAIRCGVGVSLDGAGECNALRLFPDGSPSFPAAADGIRALGRRGLSCGLNTVVTRQNAASLGQLADLALWFGNVRGVGLDLFRPLGRGTGQELAPERPALRTGLRALKARCEALTAAGIPFRLRELEKVRRREKLAACGVYCYAQTSRSLAVDAWGNRWPCSSLAGSPDFLLGNLKDGLPEANFRAESLAAPDSAGSVTPMRSAGAAVPRAGWTARIHSYVRCSGSSLRLK